MARRFRFPEVLADLPDLVVPAVRADRSRREFPADLSPLRVQLHQEFRPDLANQLRQSIQSDLVGRLHQLGRWDLGDLLHLLGR